MIERQESQEETVAHLYAKLNALEENYKASSKELGELMSFQKVLLQENAELKDKHTSSTFLQHKLIELQRNLEEKDI